MVKYVGTKGNDVLQGGAADDRVHGRDGDDLLIGDAGNDRLFGGKGNDGFYGGGGNDVIHGNSGNDTLFGDGGNDRLYGGKGNDVLDGGDGNDKLFGGSGDDLLMGSAGSDTYNGGSSLDTVDLSKLSGHIVVNLGHESIKVTDAAGVTTKSTVVSVEKVVGNDDGDAFKGSSHDDTFVGGKGVDTFRGLAGADTFTGGAGADTFTWMKKDVADLKMDHVTDFQSGVDKLDLSDFLKGQGIKHATMSAVVKIEDAADHGGAIVKALSSGHWVDVVQLDHVDAAHVTLHDFV